MFGVLLVTAHFSLLIRFGITFKTDKGLGIDEATQKLVPDSDSDSHSKDIRYTFIPDSDSFSDSKCEFQIRFRFVSDSFQIRFRFNIDFRIHYRDSVEIS